MTECDQQGLYDPRDERDACGFGMVAQLDDQPSRLLVDTALRALAHDPPWWRRRRRPDRRRLRPAAEAAGEFLRTLAREAGSPGASFAAGLVFLPHDDDAAQPAAHPAAATGRRAGVAGWRAPPTR